MIDAGTAATLLTNNAANGLKTTGGLTATAAMGRKAAMTEAQMERTAKDFESMFVAQMLEPMFGDSIGTEMFGDADTQEIYKGLLMDEYGKQITRAGGIGIASYVKRELLALQEVKS